MHVTSWAVATAAALLFLAGCGGDDTRVDDDGATTTTAEPVATPRVGECRGPVDLAVVEATTDPRPTVPCGQPHGSERAAVLELPDAVHDVDYDEVVASLDGNGDGEGELDDLFDRCEEATSELWGATRPTTDQVVAAGQFGTAWFLPTAEEWEAGARWLRCDAVIQPVNDTDIRASTHPFAGVAQLPAVPVEFLACLTLDPDGSVPFTSES